MSNSESTGFLVPDLAIVNQIKTLLKERYKEGFPIIKEILQNANDGGATRLDIGVTKGLTISKDIHPQLCQPALFFVNNGKFKDSDAKAIGWFGVDYNAGNSAKIGKFGLGQKSVFHFCESFFYIAYSEQLSKEVKSYRLLNPWGDGKTMSDQDKLAVEEYLRKVGLLTDDSYAEYFILWLPLRSSVSDRYILSNIYDDQSIQEHLPEKMDIKIATLLPLLKSIQSIYYWISDEKNNFTKKFHVILETPNQRFFYPKQEDKFTEINIQRSLIGQINLVNNLMIYSGIEATLSDESFKILLPDNSDLSPDVWEILRESQYWPKRLTYNNKGDTQTVADKAIPHCGAIFSRLRSKNSGGLTIQWAVFLPLADESPKSIAYEQIYGTKNWDYTLILHGYFFLDSGRQSIEGLNDLYEEELDLQRPSDENQMVKQWNYILASEGTLSLVIPALGEFCKGHEIDDEDIKDICLLLNRSNLFERIKFNLYTKNYWIYRIKFEQCGWQLVNSANRILSLPSVPTWQAFPSLIEIANINCLVLEDYPNLIPENKPDQWCDKELVSILNTLDIYQVFQNEGDLHFLVNWLGAVSNKSENTQNSLQSILKSVLIKVDINLLKSRKSFFQQLVSELDELRWFELNCEDFELLKKLTECLNNVLLLPNNLVPIQREKTPYLSGNNAAILVSYLMQYGKEIAIIKSILIQVVRAIPSSQIPDFCRQIGTIKFIPVFNCRNQQEQLYTIQEIEEYCQNSLIFIDSYSSREFANDLQIALREVSIVLISYELASELCQDSLRECNCCSCLDILKMRPKLSKEENRINLLRRLLP